MAEKNWRRNTAASNESLEYLKEVFLIGPDDSNDLARFTRGIAFASAGAIRVTTVRGDTVTIPNGALAAGVIHPLGVKRVHETGTTATGIVGFV